MHSTCNKNEIPLRRVPCKYNGIPHSKHVLCGGQSGVVCKRLGLNTANYFPSVNFVTIQRDHGINLHWASMKD